MTDPNRIAYVDGQVAVLLDKLVRAGLDQRNPSPRLKKLLNQILDSTGHTLSLKRTRRLVYERQKEGV